MTLNIEEYVPVVKSDGLNTDKNADFDGTLNVQGAVTLQSTLAVTGAISATAGVTGQNFTASFTGQTSEAATDRVFFIAPVACQVVSVREVHSVAAGGASTLQVVKDTGTAAPGAGTDLLTAGFDLNATANTVQTGSLTATAADLQLAAGDRLAIDFANTIQSTAGLAVTVWLKTI